MSDIVLFHSVLGLRGRGAGRRGPAARGGPHRAHPDYYDGRTFDEYPPALAWLEATGGLPDVIARAAAATGDLPQDLVYAGFSLGGGPAEQLAATRPGAQGLILLHAAIPLDGLGVPRWPGTVPVQVHFATGDPYRGKAGLDSFAASVQASGALYGQFDYPGRGHLFTDRTRPGEYDEQSAELLFSRVLAFLGRIGGGEP
ncbi:MAG TPA: dienelactone hydrolase family protein [Streptosporangiaceae bacterium]|nr:dienelactone hydrolase family protein [Streptosporangiaceae bacterium]